MEIFYNYETFDHIKNFLDRNSLNILDSRSDYVPSRHDDANWDGKHYIDEDGYLISKTLYPNEVQHKDQPYFSYKINKDGFRSQHFKKLEDKDINILYSGCSWTFGEGLPYEYLWSTLLSNKVKNFYKDKNIEEFNVAYMGSSIHLAIRNVMAFIRKYGNPDYLFINFPDLARNLNYDKETNGYQKVYYSKNHLEGRMSKTQLKYTKNFVLEDSILLATDLINMLEDYCTSNNIKLIWTTWFQSEIDLYDKLNFKYFMRSDSSFERLRVSRFKYKDMLPFQENLNNLPYWEIARDDNHPGTAWTTHCSNEFYEEFIKRHREEGMWYEKNN